MSRYKVVSGLTVAGTFTAGVIAAVIGEWSVALSCGLCFGVAVVEFTGIRAEDHRQ
ncbi:hypothetical protein [Nocardia abscessus]|uniref:hypothetical protein n=1 Tax=Nocardia abscessus TaxID=120957 RepID=UPI002457A385|nr:hypothetical protein [Nocardia abscessus]